MDNRSNTQRRFRRMIPLRSAAAVAVLALVASACGSSDSAAPAPSPAPAPAPAPAGPDDAELLRQQIEDHFQGETIEFLVGFNPGGAYDTHARVLAEFLPSVIPGSPAIVVQNVPGGVSLNAARQLALSRPDGFTMGVYSSNLDFQNAVGVSLPGLDPRLLIQLGTALNWWSSVPMWCARTDVATSFEELVGLGREVRFAQPSLFPAAAFMDLIDVPFKNVLGYKGVPDVVQAVNSEEADGSGWCTWETFDNLAPEWVESESVLPVFYAHDLDLLDGEVNAEWHARTGVPVPPMLKDLVPLTDEQLKILELVSLEQFTSTQNIAVPPGTPDFVVGALRDAIRQVAESEEYQAAMRERNRVPGYRSPEEIDANVAAILAYPDEVKAVVRAMFEK